MQPDKILIDSFGTLHHPDDIVPYYMSTEAVEDWPQHPDSTYVASQVEHLHPFVISHVKDGEVTRQVALYMPKQIDDATGIMGCLRGQAQALQAMYTNNQNLQNELSAREDMMHLMEDEIAHLRKPWWRKLWS